MGNEGSRSLPAQHPCAPRRVTSEAARRRPLPPERASAALRWPDSGLSRPGERVARQDAGRSGQGQHYRQRTSPDSRTARRSEEHTSELQSLMRISYAVFCLKKKKQKKTKQQTY